MTFLTLNSSKRLINLDHVTYVDSAVAGGIAVRFVDGQVLELRAIEAAEFWNACLALARTTTTKPAEVDRREAARFIGVEIDNEAPCPKCKCQTTLKEFCYVCEENPRPAGEVCPACSGTKFIRSCTACGADYWKSLKVRGLQF